MKAYKYIYFLFTALILAGQVVQAQDDAVCVSEEELKLYEAINDYRKSMGEKPIPLSYSLTKVAQVHARDLEQNHDIENRSGCNLHSWSDSNDWEGCCYTDDHEKAECMWNKPREISEYDSDGFEITYYYSGTPTAFQSVSEWQASEEHNDVIVNGGLWQDMEWKAIGIGMYGNYVTVWFGRIKDKKGRPEQCVNDF